MKKAAKPLLFPRTLLTEISSSWGKTGNLMTMVLNIIPLLHFGVDVISSTVALGAAFSVLTLVELRRQ